MFSFWRRQPSEPQAPPPPPPPPQQEQRNLTDLAMRKYKGDPASRVMYASKSEKAQFVCSLPANSKHLGDAQKLSLEIFTGRGESPKTIEDSQQQRRLIKDSNESPVVSQNQSGERLQKRSTSTRHSKDSNRQFVEEPVSRTFSTSNSRRRSKLYHSNESGPPEAAQVMNQRSAPTSSSSGRFFERRSMSGQKHTSDTHETYLLQGGEGRTLLASAPTGSHVARYHDQIAAQGGSEVSTKLNVVNSSCEIKLTWV